MRVIIPSGNMMFSCASFSALARAMRHANHIKTGPLTALFDRFAVQGLSTLGDPQLILRSLHVNTLREKQIPSVILQLQLGHRVAVC